MNILIINLLPLNSDKITFWLGSHDYYLITTKNAVNNLSNTIINSYKQIESFVNDEERENNDLVYYIAEKLRADIKFDHIIAVREFDLILASILREKWLLPGPSVQFTTAYRDKGIMKKILKDNNIDVPHFSLLNNPLDLLDFIKENEYPVIIKPRTSKRSRGISVIRNEKELYKKLQDGLKKTPEDIINMMVEEFVPSPIYHIDGFVINGKIEFIWPSSYVTRCDGFPNGNYIASCLLGYHDPLFNKLNDYVKSCINTFPSTSAFAFHAEVFACSDGSLKLCEIAARAGGGPIMPALEKVFGFNIKETAFKAHIGQYHGDFYKNIKPKKFCGWVIIPNKKTNSYVKNLPLECPYKETFNFSVNYNNGDYFGLERKVLSEICVLGNSPKDVKNSIIKVMNWFNSSVQWET